MNFSKKHIKAIARNANARFVLDYPALYLTIARNFSNNEACFRWKDW